MRIYLKSLGLLTSIVYLASFSASAGEIRKGATMQVKPNSIWFEDAAKLTQWQQLKRRGDSAALTSYERAALSQREAWQFSNSHAVIILSFDSGSNQINVQMKSEGRLGGSIWFLDEDAVEQ